MGKLKLKFRIGDRVRGSMQGAFHEWAKSGIIASIPKYTTSDIYYDVDMDGGGAGENGAYLLREDELVLVENGLDVMLRESFGT